MTDKPSVMVFFFWIFERVTKWIGDSVRLLCYALLMIFFPQTSIADVKSYLFIEDLDTDNKEKQNAYAESFLETAKNRGWTPQVFFAENRPGARKSFQQNAKVSAQVWNPETFQNTLKQLEQDLGDPDKFSVSDRLVLMFSGHGDPFKPGTPGHTLACQAACDPAAKEICENSCAPSNGKCKKAKCDLSLLRGVLEKAKARGIEVGLIDTSCYSGSSIDFAGTGVCVLSGADKVNAAFDRTNRIIFEQLAGSNTPSDLFRTLRDRDDIVGTPQISTKAGACARDILRSVIGQVDPYFPRKISLCESCNQDAQNLSSESFRLLNELQQAEIRELIEKSTLPKRIREFQERRLSILAVQENKTEMDARISQHISLPESVKLDILLLDDGLNRCQKLAPDFACAEALHKLNTDRQMLKLVAERNVLIASVGETLRSGMPDLMQKSLRVYEVENTIYPQIHQICESLYPRDGEVCEKFEFWESTSSTQTTRKGGQK